MCVLALLLCLLVVSSLPAGHALLQAEACPCRSRLWQQSTLTLSMLSDSPVQQWVNFLASADHVRREWPTKAQ